MTNCERCDDAPATFLPDDPEDEALCDDCLQEQRDNEAETAQDLIAAGINPDDDPDIIRFDILRRFI